MIIPTLLLIFQLLFLSVNGRLGVTSPGEIEPPDYGLPMEDGYLARDQLLHRGCSLSDMLPFAAAERSHTVAPAHPALASIVFGDAKGCVAMCLRAGAPLKQLAYPLAEQIFKGDGDTTLAQWVEPACLQMEIGFVNQGTDVADIFWVSFSGERKQLEGALTRGLKLDAVVNWVDAYAGHKFVLVHRQSREEVHIEASKTALTVVGQAPPVVRAEPGFLSHLHDVVEMTVVNEWKKSRKVSRTFSGLGFAKGALHPDLWGSIATYYHNNRNASVLEEWTGKGVFTNWWEVDPYIVGMPVRLRQYWQGRLQYQVEQWAGVPLVCAELVGMRRYQAGARVLTHVEKPTSAAFTVIVNVAQSGVKEPWMLQVYDFADRIHEVTLEPGEALVLESARCLHGRMKALSSGSVVNIYAHFLPAAADGTVDLAWSSRTNPPDAPKPLMEQENVCSVDITRTGTYKSCGGKALKKGEDIFQFWLENVKNLKDTVAA